MAGTERRRGRALGGAERRAPRAAGNGGRARASGPPRGTWHARADGPRGPEARRRESERGGCGTYFRSGGQIIPAKGEARPSGPLTVSGGLAKKGGSGKGESCSFNSLPSSSSPSSRRRRGARGLEHTARAAPAPPSLRPRGAGPARAPRAPPRLRAAQALPVFGGAADPGGGGEDWGGKNSARNRAR